MKNCNLEKNCFVHDKEAAAKQKKKKKKTIWVCIIRHLPPCGKVSRSSLESRVNVKGYKNCLEMQTLIKYSLEREWGCLCEIITGIVSWRDHPSYECTAKLSCLFFLPAPVLPVPIPCSQYLISQGPFDMPANHPGQETRRCKSLCVSLHGRVFVCERVCMYCRLTENTKFTQSSLRKKL